MNNLSSSQLAIIYNGVMVLKEVSSGVLQTLGDLVQFDPENNRLFEQFRSQEAEDAEIGAVLCAVDAALTAAREHELPLQN
jgi:hypothetical protein